jgi:hypothetical protein
MAQSFDQRRDAAVVSGRADLPEGVIDRLSPKQQTFYLSLRGSFRESLKVNLVWHEDRVNKAFEKSVALSGHLSAGRAAADAFMADFDALTPSDVMRMRIDSLACLVMCQRGGLARVLNVTGPDTAEMVNGGCER